MNAQEGRERAERTTPPHAGTSHGAGRELGAKRESLKRRASGVEVGIVSGRERTGQDQETKP